ncbi:hypothetical protein BC831DRAFT_440330 [Entophlyctis helioformis]|nr:hypothetical protein BC831DRAFT_440330 [Entophlyctis helioformis]
MSSTLTESSKINAVMALSWSTSVVAMLLSVSIVPTMLTSSSRSGRWLIVPLTRASKAVSGQRETLCGNTVDCWLLAEERVQQMLSTLADQGTMRSKN